MRKDNRGMSLIEVVIVVAIIAVVGAVMTVGLSSFLSKPAEECASKLSTALKAARVSTMGKQSVVLKLYQKDGYIYLREEITTVGCATESKDIIIGEKGVEVTYATSDGTSNIALGDAAAPLVFQFNRPTGGLKPLPVSPSKYCEEVVVKKGARVMKVKIAYLTGKISLE